MRSSVLQRDKERAERATLVAQEKLIRGKVCVVLRLRGAGRGRLFGRFSEVGGAHLLAVLFVLVFTNMPLLYVYHTIWISALCACTPRPMCELGSL